MLMIPPAFHPPLRSRFTRAEPRYHSRGGLTVGGRERLLGRPPRTPFAVRATATTIESRSGGRRLRLHRPLFSVDPAALVEQLLGVDLPDVRSTRTAELHPRRLVLRCDERQRPPQLAH